MEKIAGELIAHRVVGKDFWSLATIKTKDAGQVPAVGKLLGATLGDSVEVEGEWADHPRFGRQFRVSACVVTVPKSDNGAIAWLSSRLPNVGTTRARALLDHFDGAEGLWDAIENAPARLAEVKGITRERVVDLCEAYARFRHDRDRMIRFRRWGMTENQISKVLSAWGEKAEERLRANPYELAQVVSGFGFIKADAIAQRMGVPRDAIPRIECGLTHTLEQAAGHGHCYIPTGKLVRVAADKVLRLDGDKVAAELAKMKKRGELVQHGKRTFSRYLNHFEQRCADRIRALLQQR